LIDYDGFLNPEKTKRKIPEWMEFIEAIKLPEEFTKGLDDDEEEEASNDDFEEDEISEVEKEEH